MNIKDWQQVESIFHTALSLNPEERSSHISQECSGDDFLLNEVKSLIFAFENNREFIEQPVFSLGIRVAEKISKEFLTGSTIGKYQIKEKLGSGGMGDVYLAEDVTLKRRVALKFLTAPFMDDKWAKRQFLREAQAVAMLDHPNICAVHGIEETDGFNFIVMQFVKGETLADLIKNGSPDPKQILSLTYQIVDALDTSHAHGIIHRDIKPGNVMITASGEAKVLDFGLAKIVALQDKTEKVVEVSSITLNRLIVGTPAYMSPEQLRAEKLDFRSDIFSFGVLLYEMASGKNPFQRASNAETISAVLTHTPPPVTNSNFDLHPKIAQIIKKCL